MPQRIEKFLNKCPIQIQKRLKGIINVELFGVTCDLIKLKKIAYKNNLTYRDCAQSLGTKFKINQRFHIMITVLQVFIQQKYYLVMGMEELFLKES